MDAVSAGSGREVCSATEPAARDSSAVALVMPGREEWADDWRATSGASSIAVPASGIASRTITRVMLEAFLSIALLLRHFAKHRYGLDFDEQLGTTQFGLDARGCGQGIEPLLLIESGALFVELGVVAVNVAQVASGAHDVLPGSALGSEQRGNILKGAATLRAEVPDVDRGAMFVNAGGAGDEQHDGAAAQCDAHAARERTGFGVIVSFVEHAMVGDGALGDRFDGCLLRGFFDDGHLDPPKKRPSAYVKRTRARHGCAPRL